MGEFVTVDLTELLNFQKRMDNIGHSYKKNTAVIEELDDIALDMRNYIIDGMTNTKKSTVGVKRGRRMHYPSMPGHMPARDRGELISRVTYDRSFNKIEIGAEAGAPYAKFLESGTNKMEERPFLQPTVDHFSPDIENRLWKKIKEVTR